MKNNAGLGDLEDVHSFEKWVESKQRLVAPGFNSFEGVMTPKKVEINKSDNKSNSTDNSINELDQVFGKATI